MNGKLVIQRLIDLLIVLFGVSIVVFLMIRLIPGDAVTVMLGANSEITAEGAAELRARLGLDQPFYLQYWHWISAALHGDLGVSIWTGRPVTEEILSSIPPTLELTLLAFLLAAGFAIPVGGLMAVTRGAVADVTIQIGAIAGLTLPSFWVGILLLRFIAVFAPRFPSLGYVPFSESPIENLRHMALPALALALPLFANLSRLLRSATLEALSQDYIRTARSKGAPEYRVIFHHALRNSLIPFVTSAGLQLGYLFGGAVVIERVFTIAGLGQLIYGAVQERNYPLIQATILIVTVSFVGLNLLVDLFYGWIDPRLRNPSR